MKIHWLIILILAPPSIGSAQFAIKHRAHPFKSQISLIPDHIQQRMKMYTWHEGCPVALDGLRYIRLSHWGFDNKLHHGVLVVNKTLAKEVVHIFKSLYENHFLIERLEPMETLKTKCVEISCIWHNGTLSQFERNRLYISSLFSALHLAIRRNASLILAGSNVEKIKNIQMTAFPQMLWEGVPSNGIGYQWVYFSSRSKLFLNTLRGLFFLNSIYRYKKQRHQGEA